MKQLNLAARVASICVLAATATPTLAQFPDLSGTYTGTALCQVLSDDAAEGGTKQYPVDVVILQLGNPPWLELHLSGLWTDDYSPLVPGIQRGLAFPGNLSNQGTASFGAGDWLYAPGSIKIFGVTQLQYQAAVQPGKIVLNGNLSGIVNTYRLENPVDLVSTSATCTLHAKQNCSGNDCW